MLPCILNLSSESNPDIPRGRWLNSESPYVEGPEIFEITYPLRKAPQLLTETNVQELNLLQVVNGFRHSTDARAF